MFFFWLQLPRISEKQPSVLWTNNQGHIDNSAQCGEEAIPAIVYCNFCAKWVGTSSGVIKQHCVEYEAGKGDNKKVVTS